MSDKKKHPIRKAILIMVFILFLIAVAIFGYFMYRDFYSPPPTNTTTIIQNQTNVDQRTTIIQPDRANGWNFAIITVIVIALLYFVIFLINKFLGLKKPFSSSNRGRCIKKAREELLKQGYSVPLEDPKFTLRHFETDNEKHLSWFIGFVNNILFQKFNSEQIDGSVIVSCEVDATTLDVFNEGEGRDIGDIKLELHERRFGKSSVPSHPGKTEKEPSMADLFNTEQKPTISLQVPTGEDT